MELRQQHVNSKQQLISLRTSSRDLSTEQLEAEFLSSQFHLVTLKRELLHEEFLHQDQLETHTEVPDIHASGKEILGITVKPHLQGSNVHEALQMLSWKIRKVGDELFHWIEREDWIECEEWIILNRQLIRNTISCAMKNV